MPKKLFPIEFGKTPRLEISWDGGWFVVKDNVVIKYDGMPIANFPSRADVEKGQEIQLLDGALLKIKLVSNSFEIFYNQQSIQKITEAIALRDLSFFMSVLLFIGGLWNLIQINSPTRSISYLGIGLAYFFCGLLTKRYNLFTGWAVIFLSVLLIVIFGIFIPIQENKSPDFLNIIIVIFLMAFVLFSTFSKLLSPKTP